MLAWLERNQVLILAVALVFLGMGLGARWLTEDGTALQFPTGLGDEEGAPIRVHVAGAVLHPGVYVLRGGDRVADVLAAAGGPVDDADTDAINLARRLRDGEQVLVPRRQSRGGAALVALTPGERVNINTATESVLDLLPGIGAAYSRRIVDSRRVDGPFRTTEELVDRRVLPRAVYERIRDMITVGP